MTVPDPYGEQARRQAEADRWVAVAKAILAGRLPADATPDDLPANPEETA